MRTSYENARTHRIIHNAYAAYYTSTAHLPWQNVIRTRCNMCQAFTNKIESSAMEGLVPSAGLHKGDHCPFWSVFPVVRDIV